MSGWRPHPPDEAWKQLWDQPFPKHSPDWNRMYDNIKNMDETVGWPNKTPDTGVKYPPDLLRIAKTEAHCGSCGEALYGPIDKYALCNWNHPFCLGDPKWSPCTNRLCSVCAHKIWPTDLKKKAKA